MTPLPMDRYSGLENNFIAGTWRAGSADETVDVTDPFSGETLLTFTSASDDDIDEACRAAREAQRAWMEQPPQERQEVLMKAAELIDARREEITDWLIREAGSTKIKAGIEIDNAIGVTQEGASFPKRMAGSTLPSIIPGKENRVYRRPVGVVGVISPWNFPFHLALRSVAPALGAGNGVVIKPATETPVSGGTLIAKIFEEAGLPGGLLNVVLGGGESVGGALVEHKIPQVLSFTGSTPVGREIAEQAGKALKNVELELGGNNALVVFADADLDQAAKAAAFGKFAHQGQICIAVNRIVVEESVHDDFLDRFLKVVKDLKVGDPKEEGTLVGPIINQDQLDTVLDILERTKKAGAEVAYEGPRDGLVMGPVVLKGVTQDMPAAEEEIFGPVAPILTFKDEDEALAIVDATDYGLSGAVFTADAERGVRFARRVESGMVHVNDMPVNDEPHVAFGGEGASGLGRFGGQWALEAFTRVQWVSVQHEPRDYPLG